MKSTNIRNVPFYKETYLIRTPFYEKIYQLKSGEREKFRKNKYRIKKLSHVIVKY